ncbi:MAG: 4-(cytidine 5'-diphospho)-2-C-methyl-D-erythritol kinase [Planctomycetaceae bacterium]
MRYLSPAKINLHLEVLEKRPDGYHEIQTLMQRVDLFDEMEIHPGGQGIRLIPEGEAVPPGMDNLACQAARLFCREAGIPEHLEIRMRKRIPAGAGLGGGSGNAAAVLAALNDLFQTGLNADALMELGARLGADIPFFLFQKPALGRGKGERLSPVSVPQGLGFLLLIPPFRISTPWAYETFDRLSGGKRKEGTPLRASYETLADLLAILKNDLEIPALSRYPEIGRMKEELLRRGARGALMTGSGPVTFGIFPSKEEAEEAAEQIRLPEGWQSIAAEGI